MKQARLNNREFGTHGENLAVEFLENLGMEIIERNWRVREGELDIVARDGSNTIHFCEVKTRRSISAGDPLESISVQKARKLQQLALLWLLNSGQWGCEYQIDCMGIVVGSDSHTIDFRPDVL